MQSIQPVNKIFKKTVQVTKKSFKAWQEDHASLHAAALAYFVIFSFAPMLLFLIRVLTLWFEQESARQILFDRLYAFVGVDEGLNLIQMVDNLEFPETPYLAPILESGLIIFGATNLFAHIRRSLNQIWKVSPNPDNPVMFFIKKRLAGVLILLVTASFVLLSVLLSTLLSGLNQTIVTNIPEWVSIIQWINQLFGIFATWLLFAVIFKILPDVEIQWKDVWVGAGVTALLFFAGQLAIGFYIRTVDLGSGYGAASSLIVFLVWVYYIAQIFYLGAEFVQVYTNLYGSRMKPAEHATWLSQDENRT